MRYFYSDPHFLHKRIRDFYPQSRPFSSDDAMTEEMIRIFNSVVPPDAEVVYHLGDFALVHVSLRNLPEAQEILRRLNGKKHILIRGNHDRHGTEEIGFDKIHDSLEIELGGQKVLLNHYRIPDSKQIVLHGHDHSGEIIQDLNLNLNCELNELRPYSESEVIDLIRFAKKLA